MVQITDPATGVSAMVTRERHLVVAAIGESELEHESTEHGNAYAWDSTELDIAAGGTMLFVKNLSDKPLHLETAAFNGSNVICTWTILLGEATTTPSGNTVTGVNLNQIFASQVADATAISNETAVADGSIIGRLKTPISGHHIHPLQAVILGKNDYVQFNQVTESSSGSVVLVAHYVEI